jgi:putative aminopeptidase FrvX
MRANFTLPLAVMLPLSSPAQPYSGTIFIDPDIITDSDPSTLTSVTYTGQGVVTVYDRRPPGWVTINAYLFDVTWNDGLTSVAMVNPEFGSEAAAAVEAETYAHAIGKLPTCLREDVNEI